MIEEILIKYLAEKCGVPAYMEEPVKPPARYLLIERTGSDTADLITSAVFAVQSYAPTMYGASELNHSVKHAMFSLNELPQVSACTLNSDYNYTDTSTKRYRYQAVFDVTYFET